MIAPEPALTGPRPAAKPRETARDPEPEKARGGDFDSVLKERPDEAEAAQAVLPDAARREAAPAADAPVADMAAAVAVIPTVPQVVAEVVIPVLTPAVTPPVAPAAVEGGGEAAPVLQPPGAVPAPRPPTPEESQAVAPGEGELPRSDAPAAGDTAAGKTPLAPAARPGPNVVAPAAAEVRAALPAAAPEVAQEAVAEALPGRDAPRSGRAPVAASAPPVPVEAGAPPTLRDAAAPVWHLAADPGQGPARSEAVAAPHASMHAPALSTVAQAQAAVGQLAVAVGRASDDRVEIRLDPPELGRVQIHLTRTDGGVQAVVLADRPETQDLLRRHADELARELGQAGYDAVSLDFGGGEAHAGREGPAMDWFEEAPAVPATAAAPAPTAAARRSLAGGLDVRL